MVSFLTIGDADFFPSVALSVKQIARLHPGCEVAVYDWGFTAHQRMWLREQPNVTVVDWRWVRDPIGDTRFKALVRRLRTYNWRACVGVLSLVRRRRGRMEQREEAYAQKPYCLRDWLVRSGSGNVIYLDGDAFLLKSLDFVDSPNFDIGVTLRRQKEIEDRRGRCQVLNAGVLMLLGGQDKNISFIDRWIREMRSTYEYLVEQSALTRLTLRGLSEYRAGVNSKLRLGRCNVEVGVLDSDTFNFNHIEELVYCGDENGPAIVHFKGGRHGVERFQRLLKNVGLVTILTEINDEVEVLEGKVESMGCPQIESGKRAAGDGGSEWI